MAEDKKSATIPGGVVAIIILSFIFVPGLWNAMSSIFGAFGSILSSIANSISMQSQRSPGLIIILIIVAIVYFKGKKKKDA